MSHIYHVLMENTYIEDFVSDQILIRIEIGFFHFDSSV